MPTLTPGGAGDDSHADHLVLMYGCDSSALTRGVAAYLADGLRRGEAEVVIATRSHADAFVAELERLHADPHAALRDGRLAVFDAHETLARFMVDGQPDWILFEQCIGAILASARATGTGGLRAYGEMVGVLWEAGRFTAAIRLEGFWNTLLAMHRGVKLFCAYPVDVCSDAFTSADLGAVMCAHTHLLPSEPSLDNALERAMADVLGTPASGMHALIDDHARPSWAAMPRAESMILWLRDNLPAHTDAIIARAREYTRLAA
ncbi:MAG: hypothetical protein QOJ39_799 [Candidatus Eremiobacteraeota bacterium]|jgi:hypothetical protein|nr:hypothetical protein [Candidatus Eremiobacteraeota bacterium]